MHLLFVTFEIWNLFIVYLHCISCGNLSSLPNKLMASSIKTWLPEIIFVISALIFDWSVLWRHKKSIFLAEPWAADCSFLREVVLWYEVGDKSVLVLARTDLDRCWLWCVFIFLCFTFLVCRLNIYSIQLFHKGGMTQE